MWNRKYVAIIVVTIGLALVAIPIAIELRKVSHRISCSQNMTLIAAALRNYVDDFGTFPPAYTVDEDGAKAHSWRVSLLPYLGEDELYAQYDFDQPWDSPGNLRVADQIPSVYACPRDSGRGANETNYLAVVGDKTAWPFERSAKYTRMLDGADHTILIVESSDPGIVWTQPTDLSYDEAVAGINIDAPRGISSDHEHGAHMAFCDGTVKFVANSLYLPILEEILSIPVYIPRESGSEFAAIVEHASLPRTDVVPHGLAPIVPGRNYIFCATFQIAWDQIPDELRGRTTLAEQLSRGSFDPSNLARDSYIAAVVHTSDELGALRQELSDRFPAAAGLPREVGNYPFAYTYLQKGLPFVLSFHESSLEFAAPSQKIKVKSFGLSHYDIHDSHHIAMGKQVHIVDFVSPTDFIVQLDTQTEPLVLARVPPNGTLSDTLDSVRARARRRDEYARPALEPGDTLAVPNLSLGVQRTYDELRLHETAPASIQEIRFTLDKTGAQLRSMARSYPLNGDEHVERQMIFDGPFLIYLQESEDKEPYFAMWVENEVLLVPTD